MRRRQFIAGLGSTAALPLAARAQQPALPVVAWFTQSSLEAHHEAIMAFHRGLAETGYVEGRNVTIEYRSADGDVARLPLIARELVSRRVTIIAGLTSTAGVLAAKAATETIPLVFSIGGDPVKNGLVASLNRPGGNLTGVSMMLNDLGPKRLQLLRDVVPGSTRISALVNPTNPNAKFDTEDLVKAANSMGLSVEVFPASTEPDIDRVFATLAARAPSLLFVVADSWLSSRRNQITVLAAYHKIPASYDLRHYVDAGGLMSYAPDFPDGARQAGVYTGRILKGEKPADLPIILPTKFEFVLNLKTANALGLTIPENVRALADVVIE
jgi:putative tryptophan/tyrosine transport system substrate-binding protein